MIIAHRGASSVAPENSLSSVIAAWNLGIKAVEIDIRHSADDSIVVIHDSNTQRVGDVKMIVNKTKLSSLKTVDIGSKKDPIFSGEKIPTLNEVLLTLPANSKIIIEIKSNISILHALTELLNKTKLHYWQIEFICYNIKLLGELKKLFPQYKMLWLLNLDYNIPAFLYAVSPKKIMTKLEKYQLDGIDCWAGKILNASFINTFVNEGYSVYAYTINQLAKAQILLQWGIDGITTDHPGWLQNQLNK